ncbi:MAG: glycosyltransferase family 2 protein [Sphingomonadaceae bacterium]
MPCYNEEAAVARTVAGFAAALPGADIYVYDNDSGDRTAEVAAAAGAIVRCERMRGKGHVIRRMFADIEADIYVIADGDATYDPRSAPPMVEMLIRDRLDMVVAVRDSGSDGAYRPGHAIGNRLFTGLLGWLFGRSFNDVFSGYRVFSRRFVKSFPALSRGFEIETEISVHALELAMPVAELDSAYGARPEGSVSKLSTWRDGWRIFRTVAQLFRLERPVLFYGGFGLLLAAAAIVLAVPLAITYFETGLVPRLPTAVLVTGLMLLAFLSFFTGLILDTVVRGRRETRRLFYLGYRAPEERAARPLEAAPPSADVRDETIISIAGSRKP